MPPLIIGVLISHMRGDIADFFPEDDLLQQAKNRGISHLIKKVKRRPVVAGFDKDENPIFQALGRLCPEKSHF